MIFLAQFLPGGQWYSWIIWIIFLMIFFMFYPRLMISQMMWKLERVVSKLEASSKNSKLAILKAIDKKPSKNVKESVNRFFEFFSIEPINLDTFGIVKKLDHILMNQKERFEYFVNQVAPKANKEKQASLEMGFAGGIEIYMLMKIVRHYVKTVKKTKNLQIAMILQMQLPFIEKMAKAVEKGTKTMLQSRPIGDGLGPYVAAKLIGRKKVKEVEKGIIMANVTINGRNCYIMRASGPGGRLGYPGKAVEKIIKKNNIAKVITIDAAAKLEGEKTGSVAEGVGVAMGGPGVERSYIEESIVKKKIPIDSIIVKMGPEEAIEPMRKSIRDAYPKVRESIDRSLSLVKKGKKVIILGVGNSSGIGNSEKELVDMEKWVEREEKKRKNKKKKK